MTYQKYSFSLLLSTQFFNNPFIPKNLCRDKYVKLDKSKLNEKTKEELIEELQYLQVENAYLKKLQALVQERESREKGKKPKPSKN